MAWHGLAVWNGVWLHPHLSCMDGRALFVLHVMNTKPTYDAIPFAYASFKSAMHTVIEFVFLSNTRCFFWPVVWLELSGKKIPKPLKWTVLNIWLSLIYCDLNTWYNNTRITEDSSPHTTSYTNTRDQTKPVFVRGQSINHCAVPVRQLVIQEVISVEPGIFVLSGVTFPS